MKNWVNVAPNHHLHLLIAANMVGKSALLRALKVTSESFRFLQGFSNFTPGVETIDHQVIGSSPMAELAREYKVQAKTELFCQIRKPKSLIGPNIEMSHLANAPRPGMEF